MGDSPQALGFAVALARAGAMVTMIAEDAFDAQRLRDILTRANALTGISITTDAAQATGAGVLIGSAGLIADLAAIAAPDAVLIGLDDRTAQPAEAAQGEARLVRISAVSPPPDLGLVEILRGPQTRPEALARAQTLLQQLGGHPLPVPFFIGPRLIARIEDTAEALVFDGSTPWEVDDALTAAGFAQGPCAAQDVRGLDLAYARHRSEDAEGTRRQPLPVLDRMVPEGRLGRQAGVGWYRYPGGGGRVIDPLVEDLAREEAHFAGHRPRDIPPPEIVTRCILSLVDEAAMLQARGAPAPLIDLICTHVTGFPASEGGPLFAAHHLGIDRVLALFDAVSPHPEGSSRPSVALRNLGAGRGTDRGADLDRDRG